MKLAYYRLIASFVVHLFFPHFTFSCHLPLPQTPSITAIPFYAKIRSSTVYWEVDSPTEQPPSPLNPGKGDSLKGDKIYHARLNSKTLLAIS